VLTQGTLDGFDFAPVTSDSSQPRMLGIAFAPRTTLIPAVEVFQFALSLRNSNALTLRPKSGQMIRHRKGWMQI
jgi:hypothetical protein